MKQKTIVLPEDLQKRRRMLETELSAVVEAQVTLCLQKELKELLNEAGFKDGTATVEWEFYSEYDDEGGYDQRATSYHVAVNGESIDIEADYTDEDEKPVYLYDSLADILCDCSTDLYEQYITDITITLH